VGNEIQTAANKMKSMLQNKTIQEQFKNSLKENAGAFTASLLELYSGDTYLQECEPKEVVQQALKAVSLKLPINKNLGFAWIIPRKDKGKLKPNFQIGYKGYIQLAMRTGSYKTINADSVPTGYKVVKDLLSGSIRFEGEDDGKGIQGYFAHFELLNGFSKTVYMTKEEVINHAKAYSQGFSNKYMPWQTDFDSMAKKVPLSYLLRTYGIMSTEMMNAVSNDPDLERKSKQDMDEDLKETFDNESLLDEETPETKLDPEKEIKVSEESKEDREKRLMGILTNNPCGVEKIVPYLVRIKAVPVKSKLNDLIESDLCKTTRDKILDDPEYFKGIINKILNEQEVK